MNLYLGGRQPLPVAEAEPLGWGASGAVFGPADRELCYKIYFTPSVELDRRYAGIRRMVTDWTPDPGGVGNAAWPSCDIRDESGNLRGVVLPRVHGESLHSLLTVAGRSRALIHPTWASNVQVAARIADLFDRLHRAGFVVGDVSPSNIIIDRTGRVTLIDCDSVQFTDPSTWERFRALNVTAEYSSPEGTRSASPWLTPAHDLFGLALLIWQLLLDGDHPYEGVPVSGPDVGVGGNITSGACRPFFPETLLPVAVEPPLELLPADILELARATFVGGHPSPGRRPTAAQWRDALLRVGLSVMGCRNSPYHFHPADLLACPWCARARAGHGDRFPGPVTP